MLTIINGCGIFTYNLLNKRLTTLLQPDENLKDHWLTHLNYNHNVSNSFLIRTLDDLYVFINGQLTQLNPKSLSSNGGSNININKINEGQYAVSDGMPGLNIITDRLHHFNHLNQSNLEKLTGNHSLRHVVKENENTLWLSSQTNGLFKVIKNNGTWSVKEHYFANTHIRSLYFDKTTLWVATEGIGLHQINTTTQQTTHIPLPKDIIGIFSFLSINDQQLLLGTSRGIILLNKQSKQVIKHIYSINRPDGSSAIGSTWAMAKTSNNDFWIGSHTNKWGLFKFDEQFNLLESYRYDDSGDKNHLTKHVIMDMAIDEFDQPVLATWGGGILYRKKGDLAFHSITMKDGLPNNTIQSIKKVSGNEYWVSTENGLARIKLCQISGCETEVKSFNQSDGLSTNLFDLNSANLNEDGTLIYGGFYGLTWFHPQHDIVENKIVAQHHFINSITADKKNVVNQLDNTATRPQLQLPYSTEHILINYGSDDYVQQHKKQYRYRINGGHWQQISRPTITISALTKGRYLIEATSSNSDGLWSTHLMALRLIITPPLWQSTTAYFIYLMVITSLIIMIFGWRNKSIIKRNSHLEKKVIQRTTQLNEILLEKDNLFESTSHELRTPLSLILGHIELLKKRSMPLTISKHVIPIQQQANRLLMLVNNLLSLAEIKAHQTDVKTLLILPAINILVNSYLSKAQLKNQSIIVSTEIDPYLSVQLIFDSESKIFGNLIDNAIKYSPANSAIKIKLQQVMDDFVFIISDQGPGFKNIENATKKFKRENTEQEGSGLGLSIVKQSIRLNNGHLNIKNIAKGCEIKVSIPCSINQETNTVNNSHHLSSKTNPSETENHLQTDPTHQKENANQPLIDKLKVLIVEDNQQLCELFAQSFSDDFELAISINGLNAIEYLEKNKDALPEIIISDIMMPKMDGYQLCNAVKQNESFKYIPFVLLSAKTDEKSKQHGFKMGADDYIGKPFNIESIKMKLVNIQFTQNAKKEHLLKYVLMKQTTTPDFSNKTESDFAIKIKQHLIENFNEPSYRVDNLIKDFHMSETTINRHLKRTFNCSFVSLLLEFRLQRAIDLLQSDLKIQIIAEQCGFNSSSYFSKQFKNKFGKTAKDTQKEMQKHPK